MPNGLIEQWFSFVNGKASAPVTYNFMVKFTKNPVISSTLFLHDNTNPWGYTIAITSLGVDKFTSRATSQSDTNYATKGLFYAVGD